MGSFALPSFANGNEGILRKVPETKHITFTPAELS